VGERESRPERLRGEEKWEKEAVKAKGRRRTAIGEPLHQEKVSASVPSTTKRKRLTKCNPEPRRSRLVEITEGRKWVSAGKGRKGRRRTHAWRK
jgi:hypothetical protein